jgi:hypothetical protein
LFVLAKLLFKVTSRAHSPTGSGAKKLDPFHEFGAKHRMNQRTKPGEVWLADLGIAEKTRPILVVSREDSDPPRALVIQVPLTTKM